MIECKRYIRKWCRINIKFLNLLVVQRIYLCLQSTHIVCKIFSFYFEEGKVFVFFLIAL